MRESSGEVNQKERVAFILFTDIYRSTQLWEKFPHEFGTLLEKHNSIHEETIVLHNGEIMKNLGDGYIAIFESANECLACGVEIQRRLAKLEPLPDKTRILARIVGHGGCLQKLAAGRGYFGQALNRASRICQICHPGQMLISHATKSFLTRLPENTDIIELGSHRLRDLAETETLYQVNHPDFLVSEFPPLPSLNFRPNNLLNQPNTFIGRKEELSALKDLILDKCHPLITITAPGGYGKSRLAVQTCADVLEHFEHGVFHVNLAPVGEPERIVSTTADMLGFKPRSPIEAKKQLLDYLRGKKMLILFDNFEHLATGKSFIREIIESAPGLCVLVTSREPLRLRAEKIFRLEPMPVTIDKEGNVSGKKFRHYNMSTLDKRRQPHTMKESLDEMPGLNIPDAVKLFIDRAKLVKQDFDLTEENLALAQEICEKLNGVPLAIELTAAWADTFTLTELLSQVENQLAITARMADVEPRHRSIRSSLDWSYNLLNAQQKRVLRGVSVFKGGFFIESALATITSAEPTHRIESEQTLRTLLSELADKGWIFARETDRRTRFFVKDAPSQEYALNLLRQSEDWQERISRHSEYFAELLVQEAPKLKGHEQLEALKRLNLEIENIYYGLDTALNQEQSTSLLSYAKHLGFFLVLAGKWEDGLKWYQRIVERAVRLNDRTVEMNARLGLGIFLRRLSLYEEALKQVEAGRKLSEELGDKESFASALLIISTIYYLQGEYEDAQELSRRSLEIREELGDKYGISQCLNNLGVIANRLGKHDEAEEIHRESLKIRQEIGDKIGTSDSLGNLGGLCYFQGRYEDAKKLYQASLMISKEIGDPDRIATSLTNLGAVAQSQGKFDEAEDYYRESLRIREETGDRYGTAKDLYNLGGILQLQGKLKEAEELFQRSLDVRREIGDRVGVCASLVSLARVSMASNDFSRAYQHLALALSLSRELKVPNVSIDTAITAGFALAVAGHTKESAHILFGIQSQVTKTNYKPEPQEQSELEQGLRVVGSKLTELEVEEVKLHAEKVSLTTLMEYALNVMEHRSQKA